MAACAGLLSLGVWADSVTTNGVTWTFSVSNGRATLNRSCVSTSVEGVLEIPDTLRGYPVTVIGEYAFSSRSQLTGIIIPASVTNIGEGAFSSCSQLTKIDIPDGVTDIRKNTFSDCSRLTEITIPASVTNIVGGTYSSGNLGSGYRYQPFAGCTGLVNVVVNGDVVTEYSGYNSPFTECVNLTNVVTRSAPDNMFAMHPKLQNATLLEGCTRIGSYAFSHCTNLTSMVIPSSVTQLMCTAFSGCSNLSTVVIHSKKLPSSRKVSSSYESPNPDHVYNGNSVFGSSFGVNLTNAVSRSAASYLFAGCTKLKSVVLIDVPFIGDYTFSNCRSLVDMVVPSSVTNIGTSAFAGCRSLERLVIPNGMATVGRQAFDGCGALVDVSIPQSVCTNGFARTFPSSYLSLTNAVVSDGVALIGSNCFAACRELRTVRIAASVTRIGNRAFSDCPNLERIVFEGNAPDMGADVFVGTPRTLVVEVPRGSIGWNGGVSDELPDLWEGRTIVHAAEADDPVTDDGAGGYRVIDLSAGPDAVAYPVAELDAVPPGGWTDDYRTTKLVLRKIPAGTDVFERYVLTEDFYCGVFEVTRGQYERVMGACPSGGTGDGRAVDRVSHDRLCGADGFLARLRARTGLAGLDLPSEAQWEYACRAGAAGDYNNGGSSTNDLNALGRYRDNRHDGRGGSSGTGTTTVGSYAPNAWRLYDMHGNAWEWCRDWYGADGGLSGTNPVGAVTGVCRVVRGGGWSADADACRASSRAGVDPSTGGSGHGFRLVCTVDAPVADARVWRYEVNDDGTATVTGVDPAGGELEIPSEIDGRAVTAVGECAFMSCGDLVSMVVPPGVSSIGAYAFLCCDALVSVSLPDSVTNVMESAFEGCVALTSVEIPAGVSSVGDYAFSGCTSLAEVVYGGFPPDDVGEGALPPNVSVRSAVTPTASITLGEDGLPVISWTPNLDGCVYTVLGKAALDDADWTPVTDANLAGMHFFKVVVEKATAGD